MPCLEMLTDPFWISCLRPGLPFGLPSLLVGFNCQLLEAKTGNTTKAWKRAGDLTSAHTPAHLSESGITGKWKAQLYVTQFSNLSSLSSSTTFIRLHWEEERAVKKLSHTHANVCSFTVFCRAERPQKAATQSRAQGWSHLPGSVPGQARAQRRNLAPHPFH